MPDDTYDTASESSFSSDTPSDVPNYDFESIEKQLSAHQYYIDELQNRIYKISVTPILKDVKMEYCCTQYEGYLYKENYMSKPIYTYDKSYKPIIIKRSEINKFKNEYPPKKSKQNTNIINFMISFENLKPYEKDMNKEVISDEEMQKIINKDVILRDTRLKNMYGSLFIAPKTLYQKIPNNVNQNKLNYNDLRLNQLQEKGIGDLTNEEFNEMQNHASELQKYEITKLHYVTKTDNPDKEVYEATIHQNGDMTVVKIGIVINYGNGLGLDFKPINNQSLFNFTRKKPIIIKKKDIDEYNEVYHRLLSEYDKKKQDELNNAKNSEERENIKKNATGDDIMQKLRKELKDNEYLKFLENKRLYVGGKRKSRKQKKSFKRKSRKVRKTHKKRR